MMVTRGHFDSYLGNILTHGNFFRRKSNNNRNRMGDDITENFPNWNYGTTLGGQGQHGGYTEYRDRGSYGSHGYGFTGPRGGGFGGRGGRCPLPSQEEIMPQEVAGQVAKEEEVMEKMPGVIIKNEDGSLVKVVDPNTPMPMPDVRPEPTRFDKSVHGILNGRNAAMFVNIECKKRGWELEFEEVKFKKLCSVV